MGRNPCLVSEATQNLLSKQKESKYTYKDGSWMYLIAQAKLSPQHLLFIYSDVSATCDYLHRVYILKPLCLQNILGWESHGSPNSQLWRTDSCTNAREISTEKETWVTEQVWSFCFPQYKWLLNNEFHVYMDTLENAFQPQWMSRASIVWCNSSHVCQRASSVLYYGQNRAEDPLIMN